ncbi:AAA family ATPase [Burkholderia sp. BCC0398]|uniref:AAA family ATPase n=1 Tax=Burkholderia sp. BCC0398 TaxID=2676297 RepID=UPI0015897F3C|nr:AAA family ATPase [Burkholderia sp. BCC0398]
MSNLYPSGSVYLCVGPDPQSRSTHLDNSLLITISRAPYPDERNFNAQLFWYRLGEYPEYLGDARFFPVLESIREITEPVQHGEIIPISEFERRSCEFAIFIGNRNAYRKVIDLAGPGLAQRLLVRAHDLAALQAFQKNSRILRRIRENGWLTESMMGKEGQFAFLALTKIFNDDQLEDTLPYSITLLRANVEIAPSTWLKFIADYGEVLGEVQPANVVIGANGVGKTRLLLALARAAGKGDLIVASSDTRPGGQVIVHAPDIVSFTYEPNLWKKYKNTGVKVIALGVSATEWKGLTSVIQDLASSSSQQFRVNAYANIIRPIVDPIDVMVPIASPIMDDFIEFINGKAYIPLLALGDAPQEIINLLDPTRSVVVRSSEIGSYNLSSGQKSLLLMTARLFLHGERKLIFIDEPENHLHPQYVTLLMQTLQTTLIAMESRAVVITHSPFVVREVDKGAIQILELDERSMPCLYQTSLQTFGGDVAQISDYVFGDRAVRKGYQVLIDSAVEKLSPDNRHEIAINVASKIGDAGELYLQSILRDYPDADQN